MGQILQDLIHGIAATAALEGLVGIVFLQHPDRVRIDGEAKQLRINGFQQTLRISYPEAFAEAFFQFPDGDVPQRFDGAICQDDHGFQHVLTRTAVHERMRPARIVAEHPAQAAAVARGGLGAEQQAVRLQGEVQFVPDDTGLDAGPPLIGIDFQDLVPAFDVHDNPLPHNLARQRSTCRTRNQVRPLFTGCLQQRPDFFRPFRKGNAHRHFPVGGSVRGIGQAVQGVGMDLHPPNPA